MSQSQIRQGCACIWTTGTADSHLPGCTGPTVVGHVDSFDAESLDLIVTDILGTDYLGVRDFDPIQVAAARREARRQGTTITAIVAARRAGRSR